MDMFKAAVSYSKRLSYVLRGYGVNGKRLQIYPDDVFLVGYPKSGNTWLDFLVACLRADRPEDVNFESVETYVADIYFNNPRELHELARPRFLKSHEPLDFRYPKTIYIVRDPRAVAVSYYYHLVGLRKFDESFSLSQFVPKFIQGELDGFGTWQEHVRGWLNAHRQNTDRVLIVKYEDLKSETGQMLHSVASFLGIDTSNEKIQAAITWANPENMRRLEIVARGAGHRGFSGFREGAFFVRKASAVGWERELGESLGKQIGGAWNEVMQELGYVNDHAA